MNRLLGKEDIAEVNIIKRAIQGQRFAFVIDFHEDWEAKGFYLYEGQRDEQWIGQEVIQDVKKIGPIDGAAGENDLPISDGVFKIDPAWGNQGFSPYLFCMHHAAHAMICETPTSWPIEQRANAHLTALDTALQIGEFANE